MPVISRSLDGRGADEIFPGPYLRFARAMPPGGGVAGLRYGGTRENLQRSGGNTWKGIFSVLTEQRLHQWGNA
jgi:hypothetical protein